MDMNMRYFGLVATLCLALGACAAPPDRPPRHAPEARVTLIFTDHDRDLIRHYFREHPRHGLPPGLAKREQLPPGLRKHVHRHGNLPPGLHGHPLPSDLERRLRHLPDGYVRLVVGTDLVILDTRTRVIMDVIQDLP